MKTKVFNKKLMLNKKTIANLENGDMKSILGGSGDTCGGCIPKTEMYITCWCDLTELGC